MSQYWFHKWFGAEQTIIWTNDDYAYMRHSASLSRNE